MRNSKAFIFALSGFAALLMTGLPAVAQTQTQTQTQTLARAQTPAYAPGTAMNRYEEKRRETNKIALAIMTSGMTCTCARFAEDIRNVVNDLRPGGIRVLPILGIGGLQNLNDVLFLKNMDMGIVDQDNMVLLKQKDPQLYANIENRVHYITKLYNSELHILARKEIKTLADLNGQIVNFNLKDSQTDITATRLFGMLGLKLKPRYDDVNTSISKLQNGDIAAMLLLSGAPHSTTSKLKGDTGLHFLSLDDGSIPEPKLAPVFAEYLPGELTHDHYPNLVPANAPVQTIVSRAMLVTYAWPENTEQYRKVERFVNEFFSQIDKFRESGRHPKWREINLWTNMPGWTRFKPAAKWLAAHRKTEPGAGTDKAKQLFQKFLASYRNATGGRTISENEKEFLLKKVQQFLDTEKAKAQSRPDTQDSASCGDGKSC